MITEKCTQRCDCIFSDCKEHRFVWRRVWDKEKPIACVCTLNPSESNTLLTDLTSNLILNNLIRLDYGGVCVVNLFSKITPKLRFRNNSIDDLNAPQNDDYIAKMADECSVVVLAYGKAADGNKHIANRIEAVLNVLAPYKEKLMVISDGNSKNFHPLSPQVRKSWILIPYEHTEN